MTKTWNTSETLAGLGPRGVEPCGPKRRFSDELPSPSLTELFVVSRVEDETTDTPFPPRQFYSSRFHRNQCFRNP